MSTTPRNAHLAGLLKRVEAQKIRAQTFAGDLNDAQLTWPPLEGGWGVGMILEHLIASAEAYYESLPAKIETTRARGLVAENPEWKPSLVGGFLAKSLASPRKVKTSNKFIPPNVGKNVLRRFCEAQDRIIGFMREADGLDLNRVKIASPFLSIVRYNLSDFFAIHTVHNDRHLNRAEEITQLAEFPKTANV